MKIGDRELDERTYIIAELSANHNQDYESAVKLVHAAACAGADAIKLQTYTPDTITIDCDTEPFQIKSGTLWDGQTLYELYGKAYTPWEWHEPLQKEAFRLGMQFFSSPFDTTAVDFLEKLGAPVYKIASFEVSDHTLLKKVAQTGKPVILSTGASSIEEIDEAVEVLRMNGMKNDQLCVLKCTSAYPAPVCDANLRSIMFLKDRYGCVAGLSDHTLGIEVPIAAVCFGARVVEKHLTLSRDSGSPDDAFSLTPDEFGAMVSAIRKVEEAAGQVAFKSTAGQFKRSLFVVKDIEEGELLTSENIRSIRPGVGLHTRWYDKVIGCRAKCAMKRGDPLHLEKID